MPSFARPRPPWARQLQPGFWGWTAGVALLAAPCVGVLAEYLADPVAVAQARQEQWNASVKRSLEARGWLEIERGLPAAYAWRLQRDHDIDLLEARRPFRLALLHGDVTGQPPPAEAARTAARVVADELGRYPGGSLEASRLRRVLLCAGLAEAGTEIPSLPNVEQTLLLDVESDPAFLRRLIHHELFHFVDYADDDQVRRDPAWERLNDPDFVYGPGGRSQRAPGSARLTTERPGFLTEYATSALEEDKAEVFSFLMTAPTTVRRIAKHDPVLQAKIAAVRAQLARQLPALSASFWREVEVSER